MDTVSDTLVFVIDASASTQVQENGKTRFEKIIQQAEELLAKDNTIILVKGSAVIGIRNKGATEARAYLQRIQPSDTKSKIGDAILLGGELLHEQQGRIIAISDFINTEGTPPLIAKNILASRGITVDFIDIKEQNHENYGIIDATIDDTETRISIKNYQPEGKTINLDINGNSKSIFVEGKSIETYNFPTPTGVNTITIKNNDDLAVDNTFTIIGPQEKTTRVALISNSPSPFLTAALQSIPRTDVDLYEPPIFPDDHYEIYIIQGVTPDKLITGSITSIKDIISEGAALVIYADQTTRNIDFAELQPVGLQSYSEEGQRIVIDNLNSITKDTDFGSTTGYYKGRILENSISLASINNNSIITTKNYEKGKIFYYGLLDETADFKLSPNYPLFWKNTINYLTNQQDLRTLNKKTGELIIFEEPTTVKTPTTTTTTTTLYLEKTGIYTYQGQSISANLLSDAESNINGEENTEEKNNDFHLEPVQEEVHLPLENYLLIIIILFFIAETIIIKQRGEL